MFQGIFNYDNPVWRYIGKLGDLMILNVLWIVCSIPIFTIGASTTALYYVTLKLARDDDGYTIKSFFKSFKENFKQATVIWLILLVTGLILAFDLYFLFTVLTGTSMVRTAFMSAIGALTIIWIFVFTYAFPLQSRFYNPIKKTLFNALFMSARHLFRTLGILALDVALVFMAYLSIYYAPQITVIAILFGVPLIAFINSYIFNGIFKLYIPKDENQESDGELRPILEDVAIVKPKNAESEQKEQ